MMKAANRLPSMEFNKQCFGFAWLFESRTRDWFSHTSFQWSIVRPKYILQVARLIHVNSMLTVDHPVLLKHRQVSIPDEYLLNPKSFLYHHRKNVLPPRLHSRLFLNVAELESISRMIETGVNPENHLQRLLYPPQTFEWLNSGSNPVRLVRRSERCLLSYRRE